MICGRDYLRTSDPVERSGCSARWWSSATTTHATPGHRVGSSHLGVAADAALADFLSGPAPGRGGVTLRIHFAPRPKAVRDPLCVELRTCL